MKKTILLFTLIFCYGLFTACNTATPQDYFDIAILNSNMMHGFANRIQQSELESPSVKMVDGSKDKFEPMKRKEVIESKIQFIEESLEKVKSLKKQKIPKIYCRPHWHCTIMFCLFIKTNTSSLLNFMMTGLPKNK